MIKKYIIDDNGEVVEEPDTMKWAKWLEQHHPCHVARTDLPNGITVSTIFLGIDHGMPFLPDYEPELFETMAYDRTANRQSFYDEQWRYPTWAAAAEGHLAAVAIFRRRYPKLRSV